MTIAVVKNLLVRAGADFSSMRKEMKKASADIADFKSKVGKTMGVIAATLATLGIGKVLVDATKQAISFEASVGQINRQMGSSAKAFDDWAKNGAKAFGLGRTSAIQYGATFGNLISSFASGTDDVMKKTQDLLKASGVIASATGRNMQDVTERIRSGLLGETDAIEDLGININQSMLTSTAAFKKFAGDQSWSQLSFQTQQQILYFAILEQASRKYGDTVANNTATKLQKFTETMKDVKTALGQVFLPILNVVLPILTKLGQGLLYIMNIIAQFSQALFGKAIMNSSKQQAAAINNQAASIGGLGDAYKATGKAAKKAAKDAKGGLASFDEFNTLPDKSDSGADDSGGDDAGAGAGAGAMGGMEVPALDTGGFISSTVEVSKKIQDMANKVKAAIKSIADFISSNKEIIIAALAGIGAAIAAAFLIANWGAIVATVTEAIGAIGAAFAFLISPVGLIVAAIAAAVAAFVYFYQTNDKFRGVVDAVLKAIGDAAVWLWKEVLVPLGAWLGKAFVAAWDAVTEAAGWVWKNILVPLGDYLVKFHNQVIKPLASVLGDVLGVAFKVVADVAEAFWKKVLLPLGQAIAEVVGPAIQTLKIVFDSLWQNTLVPLGTFLGSTFLAFWVGITSAVQTLWAEIKPFAEWMGTQFEKIMNNAFDSIGGAITGMKDAFLGVLKFIQGTFTGDWGKAWEGVRDVFKGIFDGLYSLIKFPLNLIVDAVNMIIDGINSIKIDVPDWVEKITGYSSFGFHIPHIPKLARGGIVDGKTDMGNYIAGEAGAEMVVPLENTSFTDKIASALGTAVLTAMQMGQNNQGGGQVIQMDGVTVARVLNKYLNNENTRLGGSLINVT
ncbi:phage tail protein [Paenibacillus sp. MMO-58]|uniref:phage tail protein n=1 Tax=Paenibacillus sp. MMO-58 TaxID=3081290 RepID=UPI0030162DE4